MTTTLTDLVFKFIATLSNHVYLKLTLYTRHWHAGTDSAPFKGNFNSIARKILQVCTNLVVIVKCPQSSDHIV